MIIDQFFAYLSALSLLESTGKKKKKQGYLHVIPQIRSKHCGQNPGGGGDSRNIQDMKRFIDLQL